MEERVCYFCGQAIPKNKAGYLKDIFHNAFRREAKIYCNYLCCAEDLKRKNIKKESKTVNDLCWWCKKEILKDFYAKKANKFCSEECRRDWTHRERPRPISFYNCVVCGKTMAHHQDYGRWYCSHDCHLRYIADPEPFCKLLDSSKNLNVASSMERKRIMQQKLGRKLSRFEGVITTCENRHCVNVNHLVLTKKAEAARFWERIRNKKKKEIVLRPFLR